MEEFIKRMQELLNTQEKITMSTDLIDIEEWDSLSYVAFLAMVDSEYGKQIKGTKVKSAFTIGDLYNLIQEQ